MKFSHKIMLMPLVAGIAFFVILIIAWVGSSKNGKLLDQIENEYVLALDLSASLEKNAIKMRHAFQNAATVGDADMIKEADPLKSQLDIAFAKGKNIQSLDQALLNNAETYSQNYYELAKENTLAMINGDFTEDLFSNVAKMNQNYEELTNTLEELNLKTKDEMSQAFIRTNSFQKNSSFLMTFSILFAIVAMIILSTFLIKSITTALGGVVSVAKDVAEGNLDHTLEVEQMDQIGRLSASINDMVLDLRKNREKEERNQRQVHKVLIEINETAKEQSEGKLDSRASTLDITGRYLDLINAYNGALDAITVPINETIEVLNEYSQGNLRSAMRHLPGDQIQLTKAINTIQKNLNDLIAEAVTLSKAAEEGKLSTRGNVDKFKGGYREIVEGMNYTIENFLKPIEEAVSILKLMGEGNFTRKVTSDFKGDHAATKKALNQTIEALSEILSQVNQSAEQVLGGSQQVSDSSQSLSQSATEQAASLQETSASIEEVRSKAGQNSDNANQANNLAANVLASAQNGNKQMETMLSAMNEIKVSSGEISKIIKVIDEIAFQTNLLALNAAVEAARAGVHGKGFAVVAEEVRNLAQRSAKAANETTELIEESVKRANNGAEIADETAKSLIEIVEGIIKVNDLVGEINMASEEQNRGIVQIGEALKQIDNITQANTSTAEESASASQELSSQAANLKKMIARFSISAEYQNRNALGGSSYGGYKQSALPGDVDNSFADGGNMEVDNNDIINLDDDFEDF